MTRPVHSPRIGVRRTALDTDQRMSSPAPRPRVRTEIDEAHKWDLSDIYPDWSSWDGARKQLEALIGEYAALKGTLASGRDRSLWRSGLTTSLASSPTRSISSRR